MRYLECKSRLSDWLFSCCSHFPSLLCFFKITFGYVPFDNNTPTAVVLNQGQSCLGGHLATLGDVFGCYDWLGGVILVGRGWGCAHTLQGTGKPATKSCRVCVPAVLWVEPGLRVEEEGFLSQEPMTSGRHSSRPPREREGSSDPHVCSQLPIPRDPPSAAEGCTCFHRSSFFIPPSDHIFLR